jgi:hypothetical protein
VLASGDVVAVDAGVDTAVDVTVDTDVAAGGLDVAA